MQNDRWQLIERLYHTALELGASRRGEYLQEACGMDASLRQEVESLLAREEQAQSFIEEPALQIAARELASNPPELAIGQTFDRYKILGRIGSGGMGIVYSAHDSRLGRTVALKVIPDEFTGDREALERFEREFRALSALNHPNICTIYDAGEAEGRTFISMEYVAGKTLDRLIGRKGLPLREALNYAVQIASALAKAHGEGIVHRDVKPGNIMVSDDGHVKLLDFGLAKLTDTARSEDSLSIAKPSEAHTTIEGTIVGTAAYMSPEQVAGKRTGVRSDIFSFGAVLYEMITGRRCFTGENNISTMSAVLSSEPIPVTRLSPDTPNEVERIVARCLRKDPERRFQDAADLKVALQEIKEESESGKLSAVVPISRRRSLMAIIALCVLFITAVSLVWVLRATTEGQDHSLVITRLTADSGLTTSPAISLDGKLVTYASDRGGDDNLDIWVQQVAGGPPNRLTSNPADDTLPDFSPDGSKIAFVSRRDGGGIYIVSTLGGEERLVAKTGPTTSGPRFSPDGNAIAYSIGTGKGLAGIYVVRSTGGPSMALKLSVPWAVNPIWSPDGKHLLFVGSTDPSGFGGFDWWVASAEGGQAVKSGALEAFAHRGLKPPTDSFTTWPSSWRGDRIIFVASVGDSSNLWQAAIKPKTWRIEDVERLTTGAEQELYASLAADGRLVFATVDERLNLWTLDTDANKGKVVGNPRPLTQLGANSSRPSLSADGRKLAFESDRSGNVDIWLRNMDTGQERPLTATPWNESHPSISADGLKVFYASNDGPDPVIHVADLRTGVDERLCDDCGMPMVWSPDGRRILYYYRPKLPVRYASIDIATRQRTEVIQHPKYNLHMARFFPQGDWLAFHVPMLQKETAASIFIAPLHDGVGSGESDWIQVTDGRGIEATPWASPDGSILFFLSKRDGFQCIWAQHLDTATKRLKGAPFDVAHFHGARHKIREIGFGPGAAAGKLVFTMSASTGNIFMTKLKSPR